MIIVLRSMSFNAKEWINIDKSNRYNKTVIDFILVSHDALKVPRVYF